MNLIDIIREKRRHLKIANDAEKKIIQRSLKLGIRNTNINTVYDLMAKLWKMDGSKVLVNWTGEDDDFEELDMCVAEHTNDGSVIIFSVWDCNISGNLGEDAIVLLNGKNLIGDLDERDRIKR